MDVTIQTDYEKSITKNKPNALKMLGETCYLNHKMLIFVQVV